MTAHRTTPPLAQHMRTTFARINHSEAARASSTELLGHLGRTHTLRSKLDRYYQLQGFQAPGLPLRYSTPASGPRTDLRLFTHLLRDSNDEAVRNTFANVHIRFLYTTPAIQRVASSTDNEAVAGALADIIALEAAALAVSNTNMIDPQLATRFARLCAGWHLEFPQIAAMAWEHGSGEAIGLLGAMAHYETRSDLKVPMSTANWAYPMPNRPDEPKTDLPPVSRSIREALQAGKTHAVPAFLKLATAQPEAWRPDLWTNLHRLSETNYQVVEQLLQAAERSEHPAVKAIGLHFTAFTGLPPDLGDNTNIHELPAWYMQYMHNFPTRRITHFGLDYSVHPGDRAVYRRLALCGNAAAKQYFANLDPYAGRMGSIEERFLDKASYGEDPLALYRYVDRCGRDITNGAALNGKHVYPLRNPNPDFNYSSQRLSDRVLGPAMRRLTELPAQPELGISQADVIFALGLLARRGSSLAADLLHTDLWSRD